MKTHAATREMNTIRAAVHKASRVTSLVTLRITSRVMSRVAANECELRGHKYCNELNKEPVRYSDLGS